jgi:hypothetical protein
MQKKKKTVPPVGGTCLRRSTPLIYNLLYYLSYNIVERFFFKSSASAKSRGALLVSAKAPIKNIINTGNKGIINHIDF